MHEFKKSTLEEVLSVLESGSRPSGGVDTESGTIPSLGGENISQDGRMYYGVIKKVHDGFYRNMPRGHLLPYDVLINKDGAQTGKVAIYKDDFPYAAINEHIFLMRGKSNVIEQSFLFYYLLFEATQQQIIKMITGSAQPGINSGFTKHIMINVPPTELQRRIAKVLDTIDEAIQKTEAFISKLKAMKQGLLHDLLTRGLDKNGKLRDPKAHPEQFKDSPLGKIPKEREVVSVGEIARHVGSGLTPRGGSEVYKTSGVMFIRSQNVTFEGLKLEDIAFIDSKTHEAMRRSEVFANDVLLNITGASIGRCCPLPEGLGPTNVNQHVCAIRLPNPCREDAFYLSSVLASHIGQHQIDVLNAGGNREGLNYEQLRSFILPWPKQDERSKTADIIAAHETRIRTEEQYRDKLKLQKKGLMHDLLTGKVRVEM